MVREAQEKLDSLKREEAELFNKQLRHQEELISKTNQSKQLVSQFVDRMNEDTSESTDCELDLSSIKKKLFQDIDESNQELAASRSRLEQERSKTINYPSSTDDEAEDEPIQVNDSQVVCDEKTNDVTTSSFECQVDLVQPEAESDLNQSQLEFIKMKFDELKTFEQQLKEMETQLRNEQQLIKLEVNDAIEQEVEKRVQQERHRLEEGWRKELESQLLSNFKSHAIVAQSTPNLSQLGNRNVNQSSHSLNLVHEMATQHTSDEAESQLTRSNSNSSRTSSKSTQSMQTDYNLVSVPQFVLIGAKASDVHHEYQIEISVNGYNYTIYRRYKQFRQLHQMVLKRYANCPGNLVQMSCLNYFLLPLVATHSLLPYFPPTKWWGHRSEWVAEGRRKCLEKYLDRLLTLGQSLDGCPLNWKQLGEWICLIMRVAIDSLGTCAFQDKNNLRRKT